MTDERFPPEPPRLSQTSEAMARLFADAESKYQAPRDEAGAWRRLEEHLAPSGGFRHSRIPMPRYWAAMAALAAGLLLAWFGWQRHNSERTLAGQPQLPNEPVAAKVTTTNVRLAVGKSQLPDGTEVELGEGTEGSYKADDHRSSLEFERGRLNIKVAHQQQGRHFVVKTQGFEFRVLGTQFSVVSGQRVDLNVTEGRVEVRDATKTFTVVEAGGHWSNLDDSGPSEAPTASVAQPPPHLQAPRVDSAPSNTQSTIDPTSCRDLLRGGKPAQSEQCYLQIAQGSGLSAEMALYEVARLRRDVLSNPGGALGALDEYERRFAAGTLAPEVSMARVDLLARLGRADEALQASERLLSSSGGRARKVELRLLRGNLLRDKKHDCAAAQVEYGLIEADPTPRGDQAQFARAGCLERLGSKDEAIRTYRSYLGRPNPEFARRAQQRLEELQP